MYFTNAIRKPVYWSWFCYKISLCIIPHGILTEPIGHHGFLWWDLMECFSRWTIHHTHGLHWKIRAMFHQTLITAFYCIERTLQHWKQGDAKSLYHHYIIESSNHKSLNHHIYIYGEKEKKWADCNNPIVYYPYWKKDSGN